MHFDIRAKGKSSRDENFIKNFFNKRVIPASGLKTTFLPENPNEIYDKLKFLVKEKQGENDSNKINQQMVAIIGKLLEYKNMTLT